MSFLDRIREANRFDLSGYRPFEIAGSRVGWVRHGFAARLCEWPGVFDVEDARVRLAPALDAPGADPGARTAAVEAVLRALHRRGDIDNWFGETFPVSRAWGDPPLMLMERAALPRFGVRGYGVHMNGYLRGRDGLELWVARRAKNKPTYPGKLDHLVAGGQPYGLGVRENLVKECFEEAGIERALALTARPAGTIQYTLETGAGLRPDSLFVFDLECPADFEPRNTDGEVAGFQRWPVEEVARRVRDTTEFKFNCSLVIIDFLIRHGFLGEDHPEYAAIAGALRSGRRDPG